jgi:hypothetical protein
MAFRSLLDRFHQARTAARPKLAQSLVEAIDEVVPLSKLSASDRAWFLNAHGLAMLDVERESEARRAFTQMRALGEEANDLDVVATADQNLGIIANTGDHAQAKLLYRRSIQAKTRLKSG